MPQPSTIVGVFERLAAEKACRTNPRASMFIKGPPPIITASALSHACKYSLEWVLIIFAFSMPSSYRVLLVTKGYILEIVI